MNTRFVCKQSLQLLILAALGAASASTFAQSPEYRRGYDQGYRDGLAAQEREGVRRDPERVIILSAQWGTRERSCDARDALKQLVGWRRHLDVVANNDLCGDPDQGRHKRLVVEYRCGDGPSQRTEARETNTLSISCR
jgi:hypothetical protein